MKAIHLLAATFLLAAPLASRAQTVGVGIGTTAPDASAALDIVSSDRGALLPRVAATTAITSPAPGLLVYQTGGTAGFYYNAGTAAAPAWQRLEAALTATNGLTRTGAGITLGGTLTQATTLALGGNNLLLTGTGNLGVGTATPVAKLDVTGNENLTGTLQLNTGDSDKLFYTTGGAAGSKLGHAAGWGVLNYAGPGAGAVTGYHSWLTTTASAYTERMRLTSTGLGIGTATPRGKLDVDGGGDVYLVDDPNTGTQQTVFLPGHLFLAPYTGSVGQAFVQARVPNPTATTNLGLTLRTTNAGNLVDALTLSANGQASFAQGVQVPAGSAYTYAAPKTYALYMSTADFQPVSSSTTKLIASYRTFYPGSPTAAGAFEAPIHLPQGATVTSIDLFVLDASTTAALTVTLQGADIGGTTTTLGTYTSATNTSFYQQVNMTAAGVINNFNNSYYLTVSFPAGNTNLALGSARINYTVTQAE